MAQASSSNTPIVHVPFSALALVNSLLTRGYFPDRAIPPVNSLGIEPAIPKMISYATNLMQKMLSKGKNKVKARSRCVSHSVSKRKHLRRTLSIPNPLHQCMLAIETANGWPDLRSFCEKSSLALSLPELGKGRAIAPREDLNRQPFYRAQRSIGSRYLLKTDIARFYPSIYTHSIPWALHGKDAARRDTEYKLFGNRLDLWVRETQDKQTGGIPIGPDTSFVIGEVVASAIDLELKKRIPRLRGTRSIDDYFLYFDTLSEAESAIAELHATTRELELELNDPKTEIIALPDNLEPAWKSDLRSLRIRPEARPQSTDLMTLFDRAFLHARNFPSDSVLTYAAKQVLSTKIEAENWKFCEALLLRAAIGEPTLLPVLADIYEANADSHSDNSQLAGTLHSICWYHAPLQQGHEVAWALWLAKKMAIEIPEIIADKVTAIDDDVVALVALDLREDGLFRGTRFDVWERHMTAQGLYDDHWLLAYEALEQGWLASIGGTDYIAQDEFFSILKSNDVKFYGTELSPTDNEFKYWDDEESAEIPESDDDDE
jgi:hypothetical protein